MKDFRSVDKIVVKARMKDAFDSFREETIKGVNYSIMPAKGKIPKIQRVGYCPSEDTFEIIFEYKDPNDIVKRKDGRVTFIEDQDSHLLGIQVSKIKSLGIDEVICETATSLTNMIEAVTVNLTKTPTAEEVSRLSLEKRKTDLFRNIIDHDMANLAQHV